MAVTRVNAITGESLTLSIVFREDDTGDLFDPFSVDQVDILQADGQTVIETITSGSITRISLGKYEITASPIASAGLILDRWLYKLDDGGPILTTTETTNVAQSTAFPASTESQDALPRNSAVILRPILLTIEFRDDITGELFDPSEVRQVEILEDDGTTLIETIASITRIGIGKYRIQSSSVSTPKTILDKWYFTASTGEPERFHIQDTQVYDQSALGSTVTATTVPEVLQTDISAHDCEIVLIDCVKKIGVTFKDTTGTAINPAELALKITDLGGNVVLEDVYLPVGSRDPNPARMINPSAGRFEFPFGLDNDSTDKTKKNKTTARCDFLFNWKAASIAAVKASSSIDPGVNPNSTVVWTAVADGTPGNVITVTYVDPSAPNQALSVARSGPDITVNLATDVASLITTTADQIITAIQANTDISEIVTVALPTGGTGTGIVGAVAQTTLSGGIDSSEQQVVCENVKVITHRMKSLVPKLRLIIDKAIKLVNDDDPDDPCFLGYKDSQLIHFLEDGLQIINVYQPSGVFTMDNYPFTAFEFTLIEAALMAGVMSQELFAIDTDVPSWSDQGNSFVIQHQPQLAQYLNWLSARLDKMIPQLKLRFVSSGSLHIEAGPNFRLASLVAAAPSGSLFRNTFFRS